MVGPDSKIYKLKIWLETGEGTVSVRVTSGHGRGKGWKNFTTANKPNERFVCISNCV